MHAGRLVDGRCDVPVISVRAQLVCGLLVCAVVAPAVACQSATESMADAFAAPAPDSSMPASRPLQPNPESPCPGYEPPVVGEACTKPENEPNGWDGLCEYGHDLDGNCNEVYECASGLWRRNSRPTCIARCPTSFGEIVPGARCADVSMGCSYLEGTCACVPDADAGADDAGADADGVPTPGVWRCAPPPGKGCPPQKPPLGSDCVREMTCDYGACALARDVVYYCRPAGVASPEGRSGRWEQATSPDCAL